MSTTRLSFPWLAPVVLVLAMVFCRPAGAEKITITGTVLTPDEVPVAEAKVFCSTVVRQPPLCFSLVETVTGEDGSFSLHLEERQIHASTAREIGAVKEGGGLGYTRVRPDSGGAAVILLSHERPVSGTVSTGDGEPLAGVTIKIHGMARGTKSRGIDLNGFIRATSDSAGRFVLCGIPEDARLYLFFSRPGFARRLLPITPTTDTEDLSVTMRKTGVIAGTVTCQRQPVAGVGVWCWITHQSFDAKLSYYEQGRIGLYETRTDQDGHYSLHAVFPGTYNIGLKPPDGWTAIARENVECKEGQTVEDLAVELIRGGVVTGKVTEKGTDRPAPGVYISAHGPARPAPRHRATTDKNGQYSLRLAPGKNELRVSSGGAYSYERMSPQQCLVDVIDSQTKAGVDFQVVPQRKVVGVAVDTSMQPVAGAQVTADPLGYQRPVTDPDGRFQIALANDNLDADVLVQAEDQKLVGRATVAGDDEAVRVVLRPQAILTGTVQSPNGQGVEGVSVVCSYALDQGKGRPLVLRALTTALTGKDGRFVAGMLPAGVLIDVEIQGELRPYLKHTQWVSMVLEAGHKSDIGVAVLDIKGRTIRGRILDPDGVLQPGCLVVDIFSNTQTRTDQTGQFELARLPHINIRRKHIRRAVLEPYQASLLAMHPVLPLFAADVAIDPDWGYEPSLLLRPLGTLQGRLVDENGNAVSNRKVKLQVSRLWGFGRDGYAEAYERGARLSDEAFTDADGRWSLSGLVSGLSYTVSVANNVGGDATSALFRTAFVPQPGQTTDVGEVARADRTIYRAPPR